LSMAFLDFHFSDRDEDEPILLLWDDFSAHWTDEVEAHAQTLNIYLLKVPPGLTSVCQSADISWFRPLNNGYAVHG
ncbi:DNA binding protein, partial [Phytophthora megakarya]